MKSERRSRAAVVLLVAIVTVPTWPKIVEPLSVPPVVVAPLSGGVAKVSGGWWAAPS
jgi:hypothetical protein